jgi:hypothetical protein
MLDRLARYRPILRILRRLAPASLIEVGSGALGIGEFSEAPFTGVDLAFDGRPVPQMTPVKGSAFDLPFSDRAFDVALCIDALEHVPPARRGDVVRELLRVTRRALVLAFPAGKAAHQADEQLHRWCLRRGVSPPPWLLEHLQADFPEAAEIQALLATSPGLQVTRFGNENLRAHVLVMGMELHPRRLPRKVAHLLRHQLVPLGRALLDATHAPPWYREVLVIERPG